VEDTSAGSRIGGLFPLVGWTGGSSIHRSLAMTTYGKGLSKKHSAKALRLLLHSKFPNEIWELMAETFAGITWMLTGEEFRKLMAVDYYRHLTDQGDSESQNKLKNPHTGNKFHRLGAWESEKIAIGIRFWVDDFIPGEEDEDARGNLPQSKVLFGFRIRLEGLFQSMEDEHTKARVKIDQAVEEYSQLVEQYNISEPNDEEHALARERLHVSNND